MIGIGLGLWSAQTSGESAPLTTAYVTGNRTASITVTTSASLLSGAAPASRLVDGSFVQSTSGSTYFASSGAGAGAWIMFDFGTAKVIDEAKWYQSGVGTSGTWKWQYETSGVVASGIDVGSSFTLGASATQTMTSLNGNTQASRYWILVGVSGSLNPGPWLEEIEFKQN